MDNLIVYKVSFKKDGQEMAEAQEYAKSHKLGLWADKHPIPSRTGISGRNRPQSNLAIATIPNHLIINTR